MNNDVEILNALFLKARNNEMDPEEIMVDLHEAFNASKLMAKHIRKTNPENIVGWINVLVTKLLMGRYPRENDLACYCKIMLELLDPEQEGRISFPRPEAC
jgi:hypothetical protein